jgi:hypothetical protein
MSRATASELDALVCPHNPPYLCYHAPQVRAAAAEAIVSLGCLPEKVSPLINALMQMILTGAPTPQVTAAHKRQPPPCGHAPPRTPTNHPQSSQAPSPARIHPATTPASLARAPTRTPFFCPRTAPPQH